MKFKRTAVTTTRSTPALPDASLDVMTLLSMPDHLRKTAMSICRCARATAEEIAAQTKRARAVESAYLNQLVIMGYLKKERKGRKAYFYIDRETPELKIMSKIIAVHSYKGGTGKTLLSVNLAATFAKDGKKVCIFDLDFRAPSLFAILKAENSEVWFNDYLNNTLRNQQSTCGFKQQNSWQRQVLRWFSKSIN